MSVVFPAPGSSVCRIPRVRRVSDRQESEKRSAGAGRGLRVARRAQRLLTRLPDGSGSGFPASRREAQALPGAPFSSGDASSCDPVCTRSSRLLALHAAFYRSTRPAAPVSKETRSPFCISSCLSGGRGVLALLCVRVLLTIVDARSGILGKTAMARAF